MQLVVRRQSCSPHTLCCVACALRVVRMQKHVSESFSAISVSVKSSQCHAPVMQLSAGAALVDLYDHAMETFISGTCTHFYSQHLPQARISDLARLMTVLVDGMRLRMEGLHEPLHWWRVLPASMSQHNAAMNTAATSLQRMYDTAVPRRLCRPFYASPSLLPAPLAALALGFRSAATWLLLRGLRTC